MDLLIKSLVQNYANVYLVVLGLILIDYVYEYLSYTNRESEIGYKKLVLTIFSPLPILILLTLHISLELIYQVGLSLDFVVKSITFIKALTSLEILLIMLGAANPVSIELGRKIFILLKNRFIKLKIFSKSLLADYSNQVSEIVISNLNLLPKKTIAYSYVLLIGDFVISFINNHDPSYQSSLVIFFIAFTLTVIDIMFGINFTFEKLAGKKGSFFEELDGSAFRNNTQFSNNEIYCTPRSIKVDYKTKTVHSNLNEFHFKAILTYTEIHKTSLKQNDKFVEINASFIKNKSVGLQSLKKQIIEQVFDKLQIVQSNQEKTLVKKAA